jgi:inorganic pyrophosphatase
LKKKKPNNKENIMSMNLWHEIPLGDNAPESFNAIIEIPKGSNNKYEMDKETGLIALDRANYSSAPYPFDYGFAPQTLWEDGDPLDVVVFTTFPLLPGILVKVRPVAVMEMIDSGESDFKIITVPEDDKRFDDINDLGDLNEHMVQEYKHFFETYKALKGDGSIVHIPEIKDKKEAVQAILKSIQLYKDKYRK